MTIEDKAKLYDEALKKAKDVIEQNPLMEYLKKGIEYILPELKENGDEKIRKWLIDTIKQVPNDSIEWEKIDKSDVIAWLKKQGEQKQDPCDNCKDVMLNCHNFPCIKKRAFKQGKSVFDVINEEKVDNANKVEPKSEFKVGDWIVHNSSNTLYKIVSFNSGYCSLIDIEGTYYNPCICPNGYYHLWTLSDVKNGDILYSSSLHLIWIYKDNETAHVCVNMNYVTENVAIDGLISIPNDACPATKEQREQLKKAIDDAGYAFNFDKKELKKIVAPKFKIGDTMRTLQEAYNGITSGLPVVVSIDNEYYHCNNELIAIKDQDNYEYPPMNRRQKPSWSEEDENLLKLSFENLTELKDRYGEEYGKVDDCISWLKSLKQRYTWKPSDEQIKVLDEVIKNPHLSSTEYNTLTEIVEQLEKLKEE